ncbi:DNA polymerase III subunit alpha [Inmirania thermothiophila]|uniref:DNA polymerase III subunit alpha n=1 Tax=Inmirania thermothiophila TaxID=1750597 RepID=A0A3N1Y085_9GAMM|nr:DNA polymerase III subunit alpha [Inmirania thermothiophila]ROR32229.1 DNA polymerase III alpha subunit [Inmirania thermothiophila]
MKAPATFVHLRVHSEYSLVDGIVRIPQLVARAAELGMPAVAVTDQCNLFAMVKFYRAALARGVKPVVGVDAWLADPAGEPGRVVLLCQDGAGYRNLTRLVSRSYIEGQHGGRPVLEPAWLEEASGGLIALSGGAEGVLGRALLQERADEAERWLGFFGRCFPGRFYLEVHRLGRPHDEAHLHAAVGFAAAHGLPVVATNDVRFLLREDFEAHEARVCIHEGRTLDDPARPRRYTEAQYLRGPQEMAELFADLPEALANAVEIARRCNLELTLGRSVLPDFPLPPGEDAPGFLARQAREGLARRLAAHGPAPGHDEAAYRERLERELEVITGMGFAGYFLIVADFIRWAREHGVPVGPGRGSGAGSLVAYALGITNLDPIRYDLLFERFLNPERVSMPDFDIDFCMERRDRVIEYVAERYGRDRVSQIITYGSMAARAVVRDVGRVLGHPYGFVDKLAKLIPFEVGMTLEKALAESEELRARYEQEEEVRAILDLARALEGLARNPGKHAGGVVIAPAPLTDFTPLYCEPGGEGLVTQFDKDDVEAVGLVKFDFLGLRTLTIIDWALRTINAERAGRGEPPLDIDAIPLDDPATYDLLKRCQTTAVFQLESRGMKDLIRRLQPDCFEDIVALVALFRPGPLQSGMVDDFINRKHGRARVEYPHPDLEPILRPTYGVILYQEQVMQIAQVLAGYTLGGADLLRRAMGKKKPEEMAKQREIFLRGARERGVEEGLANHIFDLMEKFAGYGFNKSHSAAYALVSYQTAWLKAHHPAAFMAAVLSSDMDNTDKVVEFIEEARQLGIEVLPPDINQSDYAFTVCGEAAIRYGLGAVKGVGRSALDAVLGEREAAGPFRDLAEFCRRVDLRRVNRRVIEALIRAGAMDALGPNRATLMAQLPHALAAAEQHSAMQAAGQHDLFGLGGGEVSAPAAPVLAAVEPEWDEETRLTGEKETLGLYLTGHPIERFLPELGQFTSGRIGQFAGEAEGRGEQKVVLAGLVVGLRTKASQRGGRMAFVLLDDRSGRIEATLFPEVYEPARELVVRDRVLVVEGSLGVDDYTGRMRLVAERVMDMAAARAAYARAVEIEAGPGLEPAALAAVLEAFRGGGCRVRVRYRNRRAEAALVLGEAWRVRPEEALLARLRALAGCAGCTVRYAAGRDNAAARAG